MTTLDLEMLNLVDHYTKFHTHTHLEESSSKSRFHFITSYEGLALCQLWRHERSVLLSLKIGLDFVHTEDEAKLPRILKYLILSEVIRCPR